MSDARNISEAEVIATLTAQGHSLDDYVLLGGDLPGIDCGTGGLSALVIEDAALAEASVQFLKKRWRACRRPPERARRRPSGG